MKLRFNNNFWGYFNFYYSVVGYKVFVYLFLSISISFLDGMGLAMFMPLLQSVGSNNPGQGKETMGLLHFFTDFITGLGFEMTIGTILVVLVILFVLKGILKFIQLNYLVNLRYLFIRKVRYYLIQNLQKLSYTGFLKLDAGRIQNTLTGEVQRLFQTMNNYFGAAQSIGMLFTYIFLAFLANYQFAVLVAIGAGLSNLIYRKIYKETKKASLELSKKGNNFNSFLVQAIYQFKYLKATNYFTKYTKKLKLVIDETEALNKKIGYYNSITMSVKEPIIIVIVTVVIQLQLNVLGASLSSILLSLLLFYRALSFLMVVQNNWQSFIQNLGGMNSVATISQEMTDMQENPGNLTFKKLEATLFIRDVSFAYGEHSVLKNINIEIQKNKTVAFVGESGSGKTTLANMICGLLNPASGEILIDTVPLPEFNSDSFRSRIGYISQEAVVFNDNIFNNITFWAEQTEENIDRFWKTVALASLTDFINGLPNKELTNLGDNGVLISGGQKQRISIARELYKPAEILIFDEATSALDSETELIIQENIEKLHGSYTMVIIAHRLSTIKNADTIYLLEKGRVSSAGNFEEMCKNSPKFHRMVSLQEF